MGGVCLCAECECSVCLCVCKRYKKEEWGGGERELPMSLTFGCFFITRREGKRRRSERRGTLRGLPGSVHRVCTAHHAPRTAHLDAQSSSPARHLHRPSALLQCEGRTHLSACILHTNLFAPIPSSFSSTCYVGMRLLPHIAKNMCPTLQMSGEERHSEELAYHRPEIDSQPSSTRQMPSLWYFPFPRQCANGGDVLRRCFMRSRILRVLHSEGVGVPSPPKG